MAVPQEISHLHQGHGFSMPISHNLRPRIGRDFLLQVEGQGATIYRRAGARLDSL